MNIPTNLSMATVIRNGTVLVQRRFRTGKNFVFEFPGGAVEAEESAEDAAIRELFEETGMTCHEVLGKHTFPNEHGGQIDFVVLLDSKLTEPRQVNTCRQQTFYWFGLEDIQRTDLYAADVKFIETCLKDYLDG